MLTVVFSLDYFALTMKIEANKVEHYRIFINDKGRLLLGKEEPDFSNLSRLVAAYKGSAKEPPTLRILVNLFQRKKVFLHVN